MNTKLFSATDITIYFNIFLSAINISILEMHPPFASESIQTNIPNFLLLPAL
jgi:hypothetical protein